MEARDKVAIEESKINMEFKHDKFLEKSHWRLLDDRILIYKKGELVEEVFLEDITNFYSIYHSRGILQFFVGKELYTLRAGTDNPKFFEAGEYIKENCGVNYYKKILDSLEWRMRCNVCGQVFCYSYNDLMNNSRFAKLAQNYNRGAVINALVGTQIGMYENMKLGNDAVGHITDYSRCPHCNSSSLTEITEEDWKAYKNVENQPTPQVASSSAADEIKKFKELLDSCIITQEEFDAKKKQLLGL